MVKWIVDLPLSIKTGIMAFCGYTVFAVIVVTVVVQTLTAELSSLAHDKIGLAASVGHEVAKQYGDFRVVDGQMYIGNHLLNNDTEFVDRVAKRTNGVVTVFMGDRRIATTVTTDNGTRAVGVPLSKGEIYDAVFKQKKTYIGDTKVLNKDFVGFYDPVFDKDGELIGALSVGVSKEKEMYAVDHLIGHIIAACSMTAIVMSVLTFIVLWLEARPLGRLEYAMMEIVNENTRVEVPKTIWNDEIGRMAQAVERMKSSVADKIRMREELLARERKAEEDRKHALANMADEFELQVLSIVELVGNVATDVQTNAKTMAANAKTSSDTAKAVSSSVSTVSRDVQSVADSASQLISSISEINRQVSTSLEVAARCVAEAERTGETMRMLDSAADSVGNVVKLIEEIAGRVNLLALNATIESARAGEAGKGFAVVANEVKSLANQVATAAQNITGQISDIQAQTTGAVQTIEGITGTIRQMNEISTRIAEAVDVQGKSTQKINENIQKTARETNDVNQNIAQVTQASEKTGEASAVMLTAANRLAQESANLQDSIGKFITHFRSSGSS